MKAIVAMHVVILYNRVSLHDSAGDLDVLKQVVAVEQSLTRLGHTSARVSCQLRLDEVRSVLKTEQSDVVFNLVESLGGRGFAALRRCQPRRLLKLWPSILHSE